MGVDIFAMVFGLGFVLSFGYWCTNFLVVQRAMAAKNMTAARNTPLVAAVPKMFFPFLVIVPGMIAVALTANPGKNNDYRIPPPPISQASYAAAVDAVKNANPADADAGIKAVSAAIGQKVDAVKMTSLISANAASKLSDKDIGQGIYNSVDAYDYDGVILSLVKRYCPPGLARSGADGVARLFHVRHGGQCDGVQHGLHLRPVSGLFCQGQKRPALFPDGQGHHRGRHRIEHSGGVFRLDV